MIAAYAPLPALGLGMTLRVETAQFLRTLRPQLLALAGLLAALAAASLALLRWQLLPLVGRLARSEDRLRRALEGSHLALWEVDARSGVVHLSAHWNVLRGGKPREERTTLAELLALVPPEEAPAVTAAMRGLLKGELPHYDIEHRVRALDGGWTWIRSRGHVAERDAAGRALRVVGTNAAITQRKEKELAAVHDANHDALTGLANRRLLRDRLEQARARAARSGQGLALLCMDLDEFKPVNDTHGHAAGDELLRACAGRLAACVRAADTVARLGGDEFTLLLEGLDTEEDARTVAQKVVSAMREPFDLGPLRVQVGASVGIAFAAGRGAEGAEGLLARADAALYAAKRAGRNRYA